MDDVSWVYFECFQPPCLPTMGYYHWSSIAEVQSGTKPYTASYTHIDNMRKLISLKGRLLVANVRSCAHIC